jgi:hypothetical protein
MATAFRDVVGQNEPARWDRFILTAALAIVAGLLLSEWMNGSAIRTLTDDGQRFERTAAQDIPR